MDIQKHPDRMQEEDYKALNEAKQKQEQDQRKYSSDEEDDEDDDANKQQNQGGELKKEGETNQTGEGDKEKQKKKKKKKRKRDQPEEDETDYEVDIIKKAKTSRLLACEGVQDHLRLKYSLIESNPWILIISDIPRMITDIELKVYFNVLISKRRPEFIDPVVKVDVMSNNQFATMQFTNKQAKYFALTLNGVEFQNSKLIIEKPKQYFSRIYMEKQQNKDIMVDLEDDALSQMQMNKIYMGGLPIYLKDQEVRKLCETFGKLRYFNVAKQQNENKEQVSKGYCFFEYEDQSTTERAIKALNGLPIGDRKLKVSRVTKDQNKLANTQQLQNEKNKQAPSNNSGSFLGGCELIKKPDIQQLLTIPEFTSIPSRVIQLLNMISIEDLFEDDIIEELQRDVLEECEKICPVEKIEIPKPCKVTGSCPPCIGKVFVKFKYMTKAKKARHGLNGRTYNRRTVIASFYPEEKFERKDYLISIL